MRDAVRLFGLIFIGLMTAIFIYPLLHEYGHLVSAFITGSEVVELEFLPVPSVLCKVDASDKIDMIMIGFGGMLMPFSLTSFFSPKRFWIWYIWLVIKGICLLSFAISLFALIKFQSGSSIENEDMTQIMQYAPEYVFLYYFVLLVLFCFCFFQLIRSKPIDRCLKEFDV